jgi:GNAT superfamily N-acetyltransferase
MIILKPITPDSVASLKAVRLRALQDTPLAFGSTYLNELRLSDLEWEERAAQWNGKQAMAYLAWDVSDVCGIAGCFGDRDNTSEAHLVSMWVSPTHRRHGVGLQLVNSVIQWAQSRRFQRLYLVPEVVFDGDLQ